MEYLHNRVINQNFKKADLIEILKVLVRDLLGQSPGDTDLRNIWIVFCRSTQQGGLPKQKSQDYS